MTRILYRYKLDFNFLYKRCRSILNTIFFYFITSFLCMFYILFYVYNPFGLFIFLLYNLLVFNLCLVFCGFFFFSSLYSYTYKFYMHFGKLVSIKTGLINIFLVMGYINII